MGGEQDFQAIDLPTCHASLESDEGHAGGACFACRVGARFEMASRCVGTSLADQAFFLNPFWQVSAKQIRAFFS